MPPISLGMDNKIPTVEESPLSSAMMEREKIFPSASSLRRIGVTRIVAIVPLSFSPAMDSGATAMHPENRKIKISSGIIDAIVMPARSRSSATS